MNMKFAELIRVYKNGDNLKKKHYKPVSKLTTPQNVTNEIANPWDFCPKFGMWNFKMVPELSTMNQGLLNFAKNV